MTTILKGGATMAISKRRLRFRLRFGFGLAALVVFLVLGATALAAPPKPKPTPASDQYKPTPVTTVTLNAARVGKCKLAVVRYYAPKLKRCKTKACHAAATKARVTAQQ